MTRLPDSERTRAFTDPALLAGSAAIFRRARARRLAREAEPEQQEAEAS